MKIYSARTAKILAGALLAASIFVLCIALAARLLLGWYCGSKLGISRTRFRDQILRAGQAVAGTSR